MKEAAARIPSTVRGLKKQFYLMFTMLNLDKWSSMDLNVQFLSSKYINFKKGCPELPPHMGLCIAPVDTLPVNVEEADSDMDKERCSDPSDTELDDLGPPTENHKFYGEDFRTEVRSEAPFATNSSPQPSVQAMESSRRQVQAKEISVALPASEAYAIRKTPMEDDELLPLRCRQLPSSSQSAQVEVSILEMAPKTQENPAVQGQNKTSVKPSSEVLEFEGMPSPEVLSPLPSESGAATAMSPFSAIFEQYPLKPPSSIVKRCLQQKANASLSKHEESPVILPHTPPCRSRVVVVIPDYTPISSSREVIDLTDSPS